MKKLFTTIAITLTALTAFATASLDKNDFQNSETFKYTIVKSAELVFADDQTSEEIYKVIYEVETHNCAPAGEVDFCEWITVCEYAIYTKDNNTIDTPNMSCQQDLEDVIGSTGLIDEL